MNYQESQGVMCKTTFSFLWTSSKAGTGAPRRLLTAGGAGDLGARGSGKQGKTERSRREFRWRLYLGQRRAKRWPATAFMAAGSVRKGRWRSGVEEVTVRG
jgi:hypothetical protein